LRSLYVIAIALVTVRIAVVMSIGSPAGDSTGHSPGSR
jgi:hypothetical protein